VDYHCAWDQGKHLWMVYLMRVIGAQTVLDKPGSVVLWTNCRHPFMTTTPIRRRPRRSARCGWAILGHVRRRARPGVAEYRHRNDLPVTPAWMK
jgi:hypothetical protein